MEYLTSKEIAKLWGIGKCRVDRLAREGRIDGAILFGKSWMIPKAAQKPVDGRTRQAKHAPNSSVFRFPLLVNASENSFSPSLTEEETRLRNAQLDYYACNFKDSKRVLDDLANNTENIYIRIISLFYLCSLSVEANGGENFLEYSARLQFELNKDFSYKKDMSVVTPWLYTIMVQFHAVSENLDFDPLYNYSRDVQPLFALLSFYHLSKTVSSKAEDIHLDVYEMLCNQFIQTGRYYEACELHFLLFLAYYVSMKHDNMIHHLREALLLVKDHHFYIIAASYEFYYQDAFDIVLKEMPEDFVKIIKCNSNIISRSISVFAEKYSNTNIYSTLSKEDYRYLTLAFQGYSNKAISRALNISERTVAKRYAELYEKLGIKGKQDLVELCEKTLFKQ